MASDSWFAALTAWLIPSDKHVEMNESERSCVASPSASAVERILRAQDFFRVLGVGAFVGSDDPALRRAFKRLALEIHPDRCSSNQAVDAFSRLQEAYAVLSDPALHAKYCAALAADLAAGSEGHACDAWLSHQRDGRIGDDDDRAKRVEAAKKRVIKESDLYLCSTGFYIYTPHAELVEQAKEIFATQSKGQPMAMSAAARRDAEQRAGRERARRRRLEAEEEQRQRDKEKRREEAERALLRARRKQSKRADG